MANLLGPELRLQINLNLYVFNETQLIGEDGYTRNVINTARTGLTSTGYTNYKQNNLVYPQHEFQIRVVMPRYESLNLLANIENFNLRFSNQNNERSIANPFILIDNRLAIVPEALPSSYPQRFASAGWVFTDWPIIITNYQSELFGANYNLVTLKAEQFF